MSELRAVFGVPEGKLARFSHLKSRAIHPSVEEISQLSRLTLTATPHKIGRTVASVTIAWEEKEAEKKQSTKAELDRPKGRPKSAAGWHSGNSSDRLSLTLEA